MVGRPADTGAETDRPQDGRVGFRDAEPQPASGHLDRSCRILNLHFLARYRASDAFAEFEYEVPAGIRLRI